MDKRSNVQRRGASFFCSVCIFKEETQYAKSSKKIDFKISPVISMPETWISYRPPFTLKFYTQALNVKMSSIVEYESEAAPAYILYRFRRIRDGEMENPFLSDTLERRVIQNVTAAMATGIMKWCDIMDTMTLYDLVSKEWEERRLKLLAEATKNRFQGEAITTFIGQRADRSYKMVERMGITKKGPCCRAMDMSSEDRSCWSFEYEDPKVKSELKKLEAELVEMQGEVNKMERDGLHIKDNVAYKKNLDKYLTRMDSWMASAEELEANLVKKPHTCPWVHPGEVGWCNEWYTEYAWNTPEERKRKWAKFWVDGKKEYKNKPVEEPRKNHNGRHHAQQHQDSRKDSRGPQDSRKDSRGPLSQKDQNSRFTQQPKKTDDMPIRRSLMASRCEDEWESVPVKQKGGKADKGRW